LKSAGGGRILSLLLMGDGMSRRTGMLRPILAAALTLGAVACQPGERSPVSLDQARQITASFEGQGVGPPPRTVSDVTAILDAQRPDAERQVALRRRAERTIPHGIPVAERVAALYDRAVAAADLGRLQPWKADVLAALALMDQPGADAIVSRPRLLQHLVTIENTVGNMARATRFREQRLAALDSHRAGSRLWESAGMARNFAALGDLEAAAEWRRRAAAEYARIATAGFRAEAARAATADAEELRRARATIQAEVRARFPGYADLLDPRQPTLQDAQRMLRPGEALISFYVAPTATYVWALSPQGRPAFAAVPLGAAEVARRVGTLRAALEPSATTLGDILAYDVRAAHRLYRDLLEPVASGWQQARQLLVAPHGALAQLPLALLVTAPVEVAPERPGQALFASYRTVPFLARRVAVAQLPSVAALAGLRQVPEAGGGRRPFVGFGDPWFSPRHAAEAARAAPAQDASRGPVLRRRSVPVTRQAGSADLARLSPLPETAEELRAVARAVGAGAGDIYLGAAANERTVKSMRLADRKVVMFATHGLVPGDLDGLTQPALALSAPAVAGVEGDGLLTLDEILNLKLDADWVVLSACNTAAGEGAGAEALSGLGRAFFYAGTRALLASSWPVETTSARALTTELFQRQAAEPGLSRAEALRRAMLALIDGAGRVEDGRTVFSYAHPIFWAPFAIVGEPGGNPLGS